MPGPQNIDHLNGALEYVHASDGEKKYGLLAEDLTDRLRGQCVLCNHCLPCPEEISIPQVIDHTNYLDYYSGTEMSTDLNRDFYSSLTVKASVCTECGVCEDRCPFGVEIIAKMHRAVELFETAL